MYPRRLLPLDFAATEECNKCLEVIISPTASDIENNVEPEIICERPQSTLPAKKKRPWPKPSALGKKTVVSAAAKKTARSTAKRKISLPEPAPAAYTASPPSSYQDHSSEHSEIEDTEEVDVTIEPEILQEVAMRIPPRRRHHKLTMSRTTSDLLNDVPVEAEAEPVEPHEETPHASVSEPVIERTSEFHETQPVDIVIEETEAEKIDNGDADKSDETETEVTVEEPRSESPKSVAPAIPRQPPKFQVFPNDGDLAESILEAMLKREMVKEKKLSRDPTGGIVDSEGNMKRAHKHKESLEKKAQKHVKRDSGEIKDSLRDSLTSAAEHDSHIDGKTPGQLITTAKLPTYITEDAPLDLDAGKTYLPLPMPPRQSQPVDREDVSLFTKKLESAPAEKAGISRVGWTVDDSVKKKEPESLSEAVPHDLGTGKKPLSSPLPHRQSLPVGKGKETSQKDVSKFTKTLESAPAEKARTSRVGWTVEDDVIRKGLETFSEVAPRDLSTGKTPLSLPLTSRQSLPAGREKRTSQKDISQFTETRKSTPTEKAGTSRVGWTMEDIFKKKEPKSVSEADTDEYDSEATTSELTGKKTPKTKEGLWLERKLKGRTLTKASSGKESPAVLTGVTSKLKHAVEKREMKKTKASKFDAMQTDKRKTRIGDVKKKIIKDEVQTKRKEFEKARSLAKEKAEQALEDSWLEDIIPRDILRSLRKSTIKNLYEMQRPFGVNGSDKTKDYSTTTDTDETTESSTATTSTSSDDIMDITSLKYEPYEIEWARQRRQSDMKLKQMKEQFLKEMKEQGHRKTPVFPTLSSSRLLSRRVPEVNKEDLQERLAVWRKSIAGYQRPNYTTEGSKCSSIDPRASVITYMKNKEVYELFQFLMNKLLTDTPAKPLDYLIDLVRSIDKKRTIRL